MLFILKRVTITSGRAACSKRIGYGNFNDYQHWHQ